jgi:hypothetical protein
MINFNYKLKISSINFKKNFKKNLNQITNLLNKKLNNLKKHKIINNFNIKTEIVSKNQKNKIVVNRSPHIYNKSKETFIEEKIKIKIDISGQTLSKTKVSNEVFSILYKNPFDFYIKWEETCL